MSTTKKTSTQNQYIPGGLNTYQQFMKTYSPLLQSFATNPFGNQQFALNLNQNLSAANQTNMNAFRNAMSQFNMTGFNAAPSGARTQLTSQLGRYGSGVNANAFFSAANNAIGRQNSAINSMMSFNPLATGQNQTQTTGGVGTWLPQIAGAAIGGLTGGLGSAIGGSVANIGSNAFASALGQSQSSFTGGGFGWGAPGQLPSYPSAGAAPGAGNPLLGMPASGPVPGYQFI